MPHRDLPQYVEFGANPRYQGPFTIKGCRMYNFVVAANHEKLRALFAKCLNTPSGGVVDFWPVGLPDLSYVLFSFVDMQHQSAREPTLGWIREQEFTIFALGLDFNSLRNGDRSFAFFIPYIFVDSDAALIVGREVYGFPKRLGRLTLPPGDAAPTVPTIFSLDTLVIPGNTPETEAICKRLIEIRPTGDGKPKPHEGVFTSLEDLTREVAKRMFGGPITILRRLEEHLEEHLIDIGKETGLGVPLVFLKQSRDSEFQDRACYQSIVASSFQLTGFKGAGFLSDYQITLYDYPSDPIREDFGLPQGTLTPKLGFYVDFDFNVPPGRELWRAG